VLSDMLKRAGHEVTAVASGDEALRAFAPGRFAVVLTDIGMDSMNGWQLTERIREHDESVSVLFVTGWGLHDGERARLEKLRVRGCLFKPVRPTELDAAVQAALSA